MADGDEARISDAGEWRKRALAAAGVIGLWEWDLERDTARYCPGAAGLLAGDAGRAWRDLAPGEALAGVHADDAAHLRAGMRHATSPGDVWERDCRVRLAGDGTRRVLCRGRTYPGSTGAPARTMGVIIDLTGRGPDGDDRGEGHTRAALGRAAEHGVSAYEAIEASGVAALLAPARALLLAIGREIAVRTERRPGSPG